MNSLSYKNCFPFRLGTTSFIFKDQYIPNVRKLGGIVDDIELLFFESGNLGYLPDREDLKVLRNLKDEYELTYTIHLPIDIQLASKDIVKRNQAASIYQRIIDVTLDILKPFAYILHLERDIDEFDAEAAHQGLSLMKNYHSLIAVENLDNDLSSIIDLIKDFPLTLCLDIGHILYHGFKDIKYIRPYVEKAKVMHWHGIESGRDHRALPNPPDLIWKSIFELTKENNYANVITLEVFSWEHLQTSFRALEHLKC